MFRTKGGYTMANQPQVEFLSFEEVSTPGRGKQEWGRGFILLLPQAAVLPESDAGSDVIKPASSFVIQNRQTSCSMWCPMYSIGHAART